MLVVGVLFSFWSRSSVVRAEAAVVEDKDTLVDDGATVAD
jgi:hypothetical protein